MKNYLKIIGVAVGFGMFHLGFSAVAANLDIGSWSAQSVDTGGNETCGAQNDVDSTQDV